MECNITELPIDAGSLYDHFTKMKDGRKKRGIRYKLPTLILLIVLAKICGGIENGLHYRRDVTFLEDKTRMTRKAMARAMACINNLIIALFYKEGFSNHARARRFFDANPLTALALILRL